MADTMTDDRADEIEGLKRHVSRLKGELEDETSRADGAESDLSDAQETIDDLESEIEDLKDANHIARIADVRKAIPAGRTDDALYDLEKVLDRMDDGSRTWWCL